MSDMTRAQWRRWCRAERVMLRYMASARVALPELWDEYGAIRLDEDDAVRARCWATVAELYARACYWRARIAGLLPPDDRPRRERPR